MHPDIKVAVQLQDLDTRLDSLRAEVAALPKHVAEIERTLGSHIKKLEIEKAALSANQKARRDLELKIKGFEQKLNHLKDQMMEARSNEQYWAFQREIEYQKKEIGAAEDQILELLERAEPLEGTVKQAEAELAEEKRQVEEEKRQAREKAEADQAEIARLDQRRQNLVAEISRSVYTTYEKLRQRARGIAVSECVDGLCSVCKMVLRPQLVQDVKKGDQILHCENCNRILFYNAPVLVDEVSTSTL